MVMQLKETVTNFTEKNDNEAQGFIYAEWTASIVAVALSLQAAGALMKIF